jgi:hypothetical protein
LPQPAFERALIALLRLFEASTAARSIYQAKLRADLTTAADGTFSMATTQRLQTLVDGWIAQGPALQLAADVVAAGNMPPLLPTRSGDMRPRPQPFV